MEIKIIDPTKIPHWDDLIRCHPTATPFHSSGWTRVLRDTYAFTPYYACVFNGETLSTCLPLMEVNSFLTGRRGVSLPFTDFCAPLLNGTVSSRELINFALALGRDRHWKYLELRGSEFSTIPTEDGSNDPTPDTLHPTPCLSDSQAPCPPFPYSSPFSLAVPGNNSTNSRTSPKFTIPREDGRWKMEDGSKNATPSQEERREKREESKKATPYPVNPTPSQEEGSHQHAASRTYSHHVLDLTPGSDRLFKGLRESTRRNIRKAEKEGVTVRFATDLEAVKTYFRLHCLTRKRHGVPPQPWLFFGNIHKHLISVNKGFVALAEYQGQEVAGAVYLTFGNSALYKFGASDLSYQHLRANNSAMWSAIRRLAESGFRTLSFGRTEPENQGLIQFKSGWGAVEKSLDYFRYDFGAQDFISGNGKGPGGYEKVFQKLPEPALKLMGKVLYRHFGS